MSNALLIGLSRQIALTRELEVVANNIANLNTTGYKADGSVFQEFLMPVASAQQFQGQDRQLSYVQDRATWSDFSKGPIRQTGNRFDVAVDGDGFLVVETPRGERYTRNGALQLNTAGELVTSAGYRVMGEAGPILLQPTDRDIAIAQDGTVSVREGANANSDSTRGRLRLVRFERAQQLQKDGTSMFSAPEGVAAVTAGRDVRIVQGAIEQSNVRGVVEIARMIEVSRTYAQVAALLQQQSDIRRGAIERLAEVPA